MTKSNTKGGGPGEGANMPPTFKDKTNEKGGESEGELVGAEPTPP